MNSLELIATEIYMSIDQYHADQSSTLYRTNEAYRNAIERKLERSFGQLKGTKGTQAAPAQKNFTVQTFPDGGVVTGSAEDVAWARNEVRTEHERTKQRASSGSVSNIHNLRIVVKD